MNTKIPPFKKNNASKIISYLLSAVTAVIGLINWFILREAEKAIVANSNINVWSWRAIDLFTFVILGIIWLIVVIYSQYFYEKGYSKNRILKNFSLITAIQLYVLFITYLIILLYDMRDVTTSLVVFMLVQFTLACILLFYYFHNRAGKNNKKAI